MKKMILPILAIGILVLPGLEASVIPFEKQIEIDPLSIEDWNLEIIIQGGILGYKATVTNKGTVSFEGELSIKIITDAKIIVLGRNLEMPLEDLMLAPKGSIEFNVKPVLGLGLATITISTFAMAAGGIVYTDDIQTSGSVILFYVKCGAIPINIHELNKIHNSLFFFNYRLGCKIDEKNNKKS